MSLTTLPNKIVPPSIKEQEEQKSVQFDKPILGLGEDYPDTLYILKVAGKKTYIYSHIDQIVEGKRIKVDGLSAFEHELSAIGYAFMYMQGTPFDVVKISLDKALDIAKAMPPPIMAVLILDNLQKPKIIYVNTKGDEGYGNLEF